MVDWLTGTAFSVAGTGTTRAELLGFATGRRAACDAMLAGGLVAGRRDARGGLVAGRPVGGAGLVAGRPVVAPGQEPASDAV
ncbi:hypothetical protein ACSNN9_01405 [Micromonospora sp. URMC 107]|uniref:hypothetical protein n=1 Tax=Micromonospora sp. URMC 107 TaxID=3423418 RepID=UPI003F1A4081